MAEESVRGAAEPTIARLETQIAEAKSALEGRIGNLEVSSEKQFRLFLMWLIGTAIASAGVIIAAVAFIVAQLF